MDRNRLDLQVNVCQLQTADLRCPEAVAVSEQHHRPIPRRARPSRLQDCEQFMGREGNHRHFGSWPLFDVLTPAWIAARFIACLVSRPGEGDRRASPTWKAPASSACSREPAHRVGPKPVSARESLSGLAPLLQVGPTRLHVGSSCVLYYIAPSRFVKGFVRIPARSPELAGFPLFGMLAMGGAIGGATRTDAPKGERRG